MKKTFILVFCLYSLYSSASLRGTEAKRVEAFLLAQAGNIEQLKKLLTEFPALIDAQDGFGNTMLICAARHPNSEVGLKVTRFLMSISADVTIQNKEQRAAANYAKQKPEIYDLLCPGIEYTGDGEMEYEEACERNRARKQRFTAEKKNRCPLQ